MLDLNPMRTVARQALLAPGIDAFRTGRLCRDARHHADQQTLSIHQHGAGRGSLARSRLSSDARTTDAGAQWWIAQSRQTHDPILIR